jgi:exodeoxyribonuclease-3
MRIATWNVNSLKARLEKVEWWLERAAPDVLLLQETKLADDSAPLLPFSMAGYELLHHGEGRWNGVAIVSRVGLADVVTNFGDGFASSRSTPRTGASSDRRSTRASLPGSPGSAAGSTRPRSPAPRS